MKHLRLLLLGPPKSGKTFTAITTAPEGGVYVINSDQAGAADHAIKVRPATESPLCEHPQVFVNALNEAKKGVKEARYQTVIWDTVSEYGRKVSYLYEDEDKDGRKAWGKFARNVSQCVDMLLRLEAHVIVLGHSTIEEGAVSLDISGQSGRRVPASFHDVWLLEKKLEARELTVRRGGILGSRTLPGVSTVEADVSKLLERAQK